MGDAWIAAVRVSVYSGEVRSGAARRLETVLVHMVAGSRQVGSGGRW